MSTVATDIDELLASIDRLAAQRPVAVKIIAACDNPDSSASDLAQLVQYDATITSRILRLANSAYYGLNSKIRTMQMAVSMLGFASIRAMAAMVMSGSDDATLPEYFSTSSRLVASGAKNLAPRARLKAPDMFCLGLVSSIGEVLLWNHDHEYANILQENRLQWSRAERLTMERERYGIDYCSLSATALSRWSFPAGMVEAIAAIDSHTSTNSPALVLRNAVEIARRVNAEPSFSARLLSQGNFSDAELDALKDTVENESKLAW